MTLYDLLGVSPQASADELKQAWRDQARQYHPDVNTDPEAAERIKLLNAAYELLSDPQKRAMYDELLAGRQPLGPGQFDPLDPMAILRKAQRGRRAKSKAIEPPPPIWQRAYVIAPALILVAFGLAFLVWSNFVHQVQPMPRLSLEYRFMSRWPDGLENSPIVVQLRLKGNRIDSIPAAVGGLTSLVYFDASENRLTHVSPKLWTLRALQYVDLSGNSLEHLEIPETNQSLLSILMLRDNPLGDDVLTQIGHLKHLQQLDVRGTRISPDALTAWKRQRPDLQVQF
jgi:nitrogen fixation-related uncharacterized protein